LFLDQYRKIPLTEEAYNILMSLYEKKDTRKEAPALDQVLTFTDAITGLQREVRMKNLIFVNFRTGEPTAFCGLCRTKMRRRVDAVRIHTGHRAAITGHCKMADTGFNAMNHGQP